MHCDSPNFEGDNANNKQILIGNNSFWEIVLQTSIFHHLSNEKRFQNYMGNWKNKKMYFYFFDFPFQILAQQMYQAS